MIFDNTPLTKINSKTINSVIDRYGYSFYIVRRIHNINCKCVDPTTKEANPNCKMCLGTGKKIKIYKKFGVGREIKSAETYRSSEAGTVTPKIFYVKGSFYANKEDLIIDSEDVFVIFNTQYHRGEHGAPGFTRLIAPNKKFDKAKLMKNFKELLNEYNIRK